MTGVVLQCDGLSRAFGGLQAVSDVRLEVAPCSIHAVIGTNGAGKSTLLSLLAGEIRADQGVVRLDGRDISRFAQPYRARAGLGRTYQRNTLFEGLTVGENIRLAAQALEQEPWTVLRPASACDSTNRRREAAARKAGLLHEQGRLAGALSHGQKRQLEVAMCLAHEPRVLLLDEPLAGMGLEESVRMLDLLLDLKRDHAIVLVEHDMSAVFKVADQITVMVNGQVIASGAPERIRTDAAVIAAYLGEEHAAC
ncbi:ABC transporter ATP-binding protein [Pigmentiphaga sp. H8]|uniref:ABC transporter ATP-binding protein n=1 Tax=unclassified Pigmentiphaga TaxID=2626614 RepID=UPI000F5A7F78|nr:ABC transporter ATP-binding protein [Pigmentiphaga sp. H8]AZG11657.1 ABC transporter ATP-binding protein [Pigmentiphaga sp. H8]